MSKLVPDFHFSSITDIAPQFLMEHGFLGIAADLDNTLAAYTDGSPPERLRQWLARLKASGIAFVVVSNAKSERVKIFCDALGVPYIDRARKPFRKGYSAACEMLSLRPGEVLFIGDQIFTDILGAHRSGMRAAIVDPVNLKGHTLFKIRRFLETPFINKSSEKRLTK